MSHRRRARTLSVAACSFVAVLGVSSCQVSLRNDPGPGRGPDLTATPPGTAPLPQSTAALEEELRVLIPRLEAAPSGTAGADKAVLDACERLDVLSLHLADPAVTAKLGLERFETSRISQANGQCATGSPQKAAAPLRDFLEESRSPGPA